MRPWHEDDTFWHAWAPVMFETQRWEAAPGEVERALELLGVEPGAALLDMCCGPGRHALELARRGLRVTAVDRTEDYVASLQALLAEAGFREFEVYGDLSGIPYDHEAKRLVVVAKRPAEAAP